MVYLPLFFIAVASRLCYAALLTDPKSVSGKSYDFIVVGGGTAGAVVASRLTEISSVRVLLIEAGLSDNGTASSVIHIPGLAGQGIGTIYDWNYTTVAQSGLQNRVISYPRGYVLGGSSALNNMVYFRGPSDDFNRIASVSGDSGWSWNNMLQYVFKHERHVPTWNNLNQTGEFTPSVHGYGPVMSSLGGSPTDFEARVINTTKIVPEFPYNQDLNSGYSLGVGWLQSSVGQGARSDSSTAYLWPALGRSNLDVLIQTQVTKLIQTNAATSEFRGVQFQQPGGPVYNLTANKEVILSAGSVGTPQILMLSGIGDPTALKKVGIKNLVKLSDVGQNLQDQPIAFIQWAVNSNTVGSFLSNTTAVGSSLAQWAASKTGTFASNFLLNTIAFLRLPSSSPILSQFGDPSSGKNSPHYVLSFVGAFFGNPGQTAPATGNWMTISVNVQSPTSRGSITLASSDPFKHPIIDPAFLSTDFDIQTFTAGVQAAYRFAASPSFKGFVGNPFNNLTNSALISNWLRQNAATIKHPVSTAKISKANDTHGVVGPHLQVKGTSRLRVVDASVIPYAVGGFPQALVYMIAERASDLIKSDYNLH